MNLQLQTAYVVAAQHSLDVRKSTLEDVRAQRNWLERCEAFSTSVSIPANGELLFDSERLSLLKQLELVVADHDQVGVA